MKLALKEMKKNKSKFGIFGSIVLFISFLTFMIAGLANGLSEDNASLIRNLDEGHIYMTTEANNNSNLSSLSLQQQEEYIATYKTAVTLSIQMGLVFNAAHQQSSVAFIKSSKSPLFPQVKQGEIILDESLKKTGIAIGDTLSNTQFNGKWIVKGFYKNGKINHSPAAFIHPKDFNAMYRDDAAQMLFIPGEQETKIAGLTAYTNKDYLQTLPSYKAEQLTLNMIIWFLVVISGLLFSIFFYMMNIQKMGLFGILKAIGMKTSAVFTMIWTQMFVISIIALAISFSVIQLIQFIIPKEMPFFFPLPVALLLSLLFLVIGFIGATISGIQIKKIAPLQAIQQGDM